jgi:hypothetical protein
MGPSRVALFTYDNETFIVESFRDEAVEVKIILDKALGSPVDLQNRETFTGDEITDWRRQPTGKMSYPVSIKPHSYRVFGVFADKGG